MLQTLAGDNFGTLAVAGTVQAVYTFALVPGLSYTSAACTFPAPAHQTLVCKTVAGVGPATSWQVTIGSQPSNVYATTFRYTSPSISSFSPTYISTLDTAGLQDITISGTSFGPTST